MKIIFTLAFLSSTSLFHSWKSFHQNQRTRPSAKFIQSSSSTLYAALSEQEQLTAVHHFFDNRIEKSILDFISNFTTSSASTTKSSTTSNLQERPGFAYGLGVDTWAAGGVYAGTLTSWNQFPTIRWMSKSILERVEDFQYTKTCYNTSTAAASALLISKPTDQISRQVDYHIILGPSNDMPHLKIRLIRTTTNEFQLHLDFIPRRELLSNINSYYDKYFQGFDTMYFRKTDTAVREYNFIRNPPSMSVLSRLLTSPFAIHLSTASGSSNTNIKLKSTATVNDLKEDYSMILELLQDHLKLWKSWYDNHNNDNNNENNVNIQHQQSSVNTTSSSTSSSSSTLLLSRDQAVLDLLHEEIKYSYAEILGGAFAPKATDIALAMMGPDFVSTFSHPPSTATTAAVPASSNNNSNFSKTTTDNNTVNPVVNTTTTKTSTSTTKSSPQQQQHQVTGKFHSKLKPIQ